MGGAIFDFLKLYWQEHWWHTFESHSLRQQYLETTSQIGHIFSGENPNGSYDQEFHSKYIESWTENVMKARK